MKHVRWIIRSLLVLVFIVGSLAGWQWFRSEHRTLASDALKAPRSYRVFNPNSQGPFIYVLDGQSLKHGLSSAVIFSINAVFRRHQLPQIIAVETTGDRDKDFRPISSTPTHWRSKISGHSDRFDRFLVEELFVEVEGKNAGATQRFLTGHSLAGLYALDLAARKPQLFRGVFVFAPTFSHDISISKRLPRACVADLNLYANWGLESARDTEVFENTVKRWKSDAGCRRFTPVTRRHYGAIHQIVMITGQVDVAFRFLD